MSGDLTVCSVAYQSGTCLDLHRSLSDRLNPAWDSPWVIVENTEPDGPDRVARDDPRFHVAPGPRAPKEVGHARGSYHHAAGLHRALDMVPTRYVLLVDPDFFIVRYGWARDVVAHMRAEGLSFFGAPYYPSRSTKYRYFPCAICLFIDLERVPRRRLDFTPEIVAFNAARSASYRRLLARGLLGRAPSDSSGITADMAREVVGRRLLLRLAPSLIARFDYALSDYTSRDVGYRVFKTFAKDRRHRSECLQPVWANPLLASGGSLRTRLGRRLCRWLLPQSLSRYPKRAAYSGITGFREFGLPDLVGRGWEEYLWRDRPFGFHVQGLFQQVRAVAQEDLRAIVSRFADDRSAPTTATSRERESPGGKSHPSDPRLVRSDAT